MGTVGNSGRAAALFQYTEEGIAKADYFGLRRAYRRTACFPLPSLFSVIHQQNVTCLLQQQYYLSVT